MARTKAPEAPGGGLFASVPSTDMSAQAAEGAQEAFDDNTAVTRDTSARSGAMVALPGGKLRDAAEYYDDAEYFAEDHSSIFADPHAYMKEVKPGHLYVWAAKADPHTLARKRAGHYRAVGKEELREDTALPIETHTMAGGEYVACYDVLLFEVNPSSVKRLYKKREADAVLRSANALPFRTFKDNLRNRSGGLVSAQLTVKDAKTGDILVKDT